MLAFRIVTVITTHDIYVDDEAEEENHVILHIVKTKHQMQTGGRRSMCSSEHIYYIGDIIVHNESYKRKLIFTNNKTATDNEIYRHELEENKGSCK